MYLKSNNVTLNTKDGPVLASAVVLALNSPVLKKKILQLDEDGKEIAIDFEGYSKESVKVFLKACYQGRLDLQRENMPDIHKISHAYQVFWLAEAVYEDFKHRVKRCAEKTYCFKTAHFLFKEAVNTLFLRKKRSFLDFFIQSFASVPDRIRNDFLKCCLGSMQNYSAKVLEIVAEMAGGRVDIVVNALVNHISAIGNLDDNARGLLHSINFQYLQEQHKEAFNALFDVLLDLSQKVKLSNEDLCMILRLRHNAGKSNSIKGWNRNITLSNLFHTRLSNDFEGDKLEGDDLEDEIDLFSSSGSDLENDSRSKISSSSSDTYYSSREECDESENEVKSEESEDSVDSSHENTEDTVRFMGRMMKLKASENISNLYMMIEDLWDWLLTQGNKRLDIEFADLMPVLECIKTHRGWFKISPRFIDCIGNIDDNENVEKFREVIKSTSSLFSDNENPAIKSREDYDLKTLLQESREGNIAFDFQHINVKDCPIEGFCGFLFKLSLGATDDFKMELGYSKSDFENLNPKVHFHDNLMFAQRMHVMITGYKGKHWSLPLSWEDKPTFDENKNMISWGRHRFPVEVRGGSSLSEGASTSSTTSTKTNPDPSASSSTLTETKLEPSSSTSTQSDPGNSLESKTEDCSDWVYQWGAEDKVRLMVYYCTE